MYMYKQACESSNRSVVGRTPFPAVAEASRSKIAFITPLGLFQFRVMPFGLHGAPAIFQHMMDRLVDGLGDF